MKQGSHVVVFKQAAYYGASVITSERFRPCFRWPHCNHLKSVMCIQYLWMYDNVRLELAFDRTYDPRLVPLYGFDYGFESVDID